MLQAINVVFDECEDKCTKVSELDLSRFDAALLLHLGAGRFSGCKTVTQFVIPIGTETREFMLPLRGPKFS